jgi:16S rRNA G1207 methylase RsmC
VTSEQYFSPNPTAPTRSGVVELTVAGRALRLRTAGGVFSAARLDLGTAVLLRKAVLPVATTGTLLDLGCGYGPIACTLAVSAPAATVYAVDVNRRALDLVRDNAAAAGVGDRVVVATPDAVPAEVRFAEIWSNPPIRVGKAELHALLDRWLPRLAPDGTGWLVVARHLGADSLAEWLSGREWMISRQWAVDRHASQKGFRILRIGRPGVPGAEKP